MPSKKHCVSRLRKKYKDIDKASLERIVDDIDAFQSAKRQLEIDPRKTLDGFMEDYTYALAQQRKSLAENLVKSKVNFATALMDAFKDDPVEAMLAIMGGTIRKAPGLGPSVNRISIDIERKASSMLIQGLEEKGLWKFASSGNSDRDIMQEVWELRQFGKPGSTGNKHAAEAAKVIHKVNNYLIRTMQDSGATIKYLDGWIMRQTHDPSLVIKVDKETWKSKLRAYGLDEDRTFGEAKGNVELENLILDENYKSITEDSWNQGVGQFIDDTLASIRDPNKLNKRISKSRAIHFKDGFSLHDYNKEFGRQDLMSSLHSSIIKTSRNAAMIQKFGTNPQAGFERLWNKLEKHYGKHPDPEMREKILTRMEAKKDRVKGEFLQIRGDTKRGGVSKKAKFGKAAQTVARMTMLGKASITTLGDIPAAASTLRSKTGDNLFSAHYRVIKNFIADMPDVEKRKAVGKRLNVMITDHIGSMHNKFDSNDTVPGTLGNMQRIFFRLNGLTYQSIFGKSSMAGTIAGELGDNAHKGFMELSDWHQGALAQYGIGDAEWNLIRKATEDVGGVKMLTSEAIDELSDDAFKAYRGDRKITLSALRQEVWQKYQGFISDFTDDAIITPGSREESWWLRGNTEDSLWGFAARLFMQFKTVPMAIHRVYGRAAFGSPTAQANTFRELFQWDSLYRLNKKTDMQNLIGFMVSGWAVGYLALSADALIEGRNPPDPADPQTWKDAFVKGGPGGLWMDFMLADYDDTHRNLAMDIVGPVPGKIVEGAVVGATIRDIWQDGREGKDAAAKAVKYLGSLVPFQNHIFTELPLKYMLLHEINESLNPGYSRKLKNKVRGDTGFWEINGFSPGDPTERLGR